MSKRAVRHRAETGRLHRKYDGVFAVGTPDLTLEGEWMAAVLACGEGAALSHHTGAMRWGIRRRLRGPIHISVPEGRQPALDGLIIHRRRCLEVATQQGIPVTPLVTTMLDVTPDLGDEEIERMIGAADRLELIDPESLREELDGRRRERGLPRLKRVLDKHTFVLTHSELERLFVPLAKRAGLGPPTGQKRFPNGRVDFYWERLDLVVECDGLRYHRTPTQQSADLYRDHAHREAGRQVLRFSHYQVKYDPAHVERTMRALAA
jgi:Protein of unknown function (DUF559)